MERAGNGQPCLEAANTEPVMLYYWRVKELNARNRLSRFAPGLISGQKHLVRSGEVPDGPGLRTCRHFKGENLEILEDRSMPP